MLKVLIAVVVVLICWWALDGSPSFQICLHQDHQRAGAPSDYLTQFVSTAETYRDCVGELVKSNKEEIVAWFTILLAFSTIFLWFATRDLVRSAEKTSRAELRAYVGVENASIRDIEDGKRPIIELRYKNFGRTPAYAVQTWVDSVIEKVGTIDPKIEEKLSSTSILDPDNSATVLSTMTASLTKNEALEIAADTKRIYVVGAVQFKDIFGRRQKTTFGFETGGSSLFQNNRMIRSEGKSTAT